MKVEQKSVIEGFVVSEGTAHFTGQRTKNGVSLSRGKNTLVIPNGAIGQEVLKQLSAMVGLGEEVVKPKRVRRTKAQIEAEKGLA